MGIIINAHTARRISPRRDTLVISPISRMKLIPHLTTACLSKIGTSATTPF